MANFQLSPGINLNFPFKSTENNSQNLSYLDANSGLGLELNMQINLPLAFSLNLGGSYNFGSAKSQYSYFDQSTSTTTSASNLNTSYSFYTTTGTLRFHLINFEKIKLYAGFGYLAGALLLSHQSSDFESKHGSLSGFHQTESSTFSNQLLESGVEYYWSKTDGLQLLGKFYKIKTANHFSTLNSSTISTRITQLSLLYNHVVGWDFFWK